MQTFTFWNNKGGTGKTSLAFQSICSYAHKNSNKKILVIDTCPQANLSELLLGGLEGKGAENLLKRQGESNRATLGGYFQKRLPSPFDAKSLTYQYCQEYLTDPSKFNENIPNNITLFCGDPLLELQSNAVSTLANTQIPGSNTWILIIDWIKNFMDACENNYDVCFIDTNPSFSIYTQMSLAATDKLIMPIMADDSSRRALINAFSLVYSLKLPSDIYAQYAFRTKLENAKRKLPKVHLLVKNRITQYMLSDASGYAAIFRNLESEIGSLITTHHDYFSFDMLNNGLISIRDFQTTGVVAFARGCPFYSLKPGTPSVQGKRITLNRLNINNVTSAIDDLVNKLN